MEKHWSHSVEFKRQVAQELLADETLHGLPNATTFPATNNRALPTLSSPAQERQAVETIDGRRDRPERSAARIEVPWPRHLAKVEWKPPPKPRRDEDVLYEAARSESHGTRLRSSGR